MKRISLALSGLVAILAIVGATWWYTSPGPPPVAAKQAAQTPAEDQNAAEAGCTEKELSAVPTVKRATERQRCAAAREQHYYAQANLDQAARSTDAAERGVVIAYRQSRGGFVQAIATVAAFIAASWAAWAASHAAAWARKAANETEKGADAAVKALAVTEDASHRQLRPYVFVVKPDRGGPITNDGHTTIVVKNFGQTPARKITISRGAIVRARPIGDIIVPLVGAPERVIDLAPGGALDLYQGMDSFRSEDFAKLQAGELVVLVRIRVEYEFAPDAFDAHDLTMVLSEDALRLGALAHLGEYERNRTPPAQNS